MISAESVFVVRFCGASKVANVPTLLVVMLCLWSCKSRTTDRAIVLQGSAVRATSCLALFLSCCASRDPRVGLYVPVWNNALTCCGSLGGSVLANLLGLGMEMCGRKIKN